MDAMQVAKEAASSAMTLDAKRDVRNATRVIAVAEEEMNVRFRHRDTYVIPIGCRTSPRVHVAGMALDFPGSRISYA